MDPYDLSKRPGGGYQPEPSGSAPKPPQGGSGTATKLDRAASIRALAERMLAALNATKFEPDLKRDEATYRGLAGGCFRAAGWCTDELDRLEAAEREKERDREIDGLERLADLDMNDEREKGGE